MNRFREIGMKLTPQRLAILEYLEGNTSHPSAEEIYRAVSDRFPTMSFATVYNTLDALEQRGNVRELTIDPDKKRYDPNVSRHNHIICTACRKIVDIPADFRVELPADLAQAFVITGNHVEFYGICPGCRADRPKTDS